MLKELLKKPTILLPKQHIMLCSHMRANTTLLGHILGSHPDVSGYYEQHIGYSSWKSLIRNKLKFSTENPNEPVTRFYFDKILHNEHYLTEEVFKRENVRLFFMLRNPERSIKSIVSLYQRIDSNNAFANPEFATGYYIERVAKIAEIAQSYAQYKTLYYLDAELLVKDTERSLQSLSRWFGLTPALNSSYRMFELTGAKRHGDPSEQIKTGNVNQKVTSYADIIIDSALIDEAKMAYQLARASIVDRAESDNMLIKQQG